LLEEPFPPQEDALFLTSAAAARRAAIEAGIHEVVRLYIGWLAVRAPADPLLAEAAVPNMAIQDLHEALRAFNQRLLNGRTRIAVSPAAFAELAGNAASSCEAEAARLALAAGRAGWPFAGGEAEMEFSRARGAAYAWAVLLRDAAADAQTEGQAAEAARRAGLALQAVIRREPLFLFNGALGGGAEGNGLAPAHLADAVQHLRAGAAEARAMGAALAAGPAALKPTAL
jgi:hypothetical protein